MICLYEDFKSNPIGQLQNIFRFLGVEESFEPDISIQHNVSILPKNKALHSFVSRPNRIKDILKQFIPGNLRRRIANHVQERNVGKPRKLLPHVRRQLIKVYREDILKLQDLIQRDLSKWFE